mmetsp:Transcript_1956/g.4409  ORF Transcript_1956/g.4409 Transcript_1956/m.4409 type:complete len:142 (-) Transcript_1956:1751-2176(-)
MGRGAQRRDECEFLHVCVYAYAFMCARMKHELVVLGMKACPMVTQKVLQAEAGPPTHPYCLLHLWKGVARDAAEGNRRSWMDVATCVMLMDEWMDVAILVCDAYGKVLPGMQQEAIGGLMNVALPLSLCLSLSLSLSFTGH